MAIRNKMQFFHCEQIIMANLMIFLKLIRNTTQKSFFFLAYAANQYYNLKQSGLIL